MLSGSEREHLQSVSLAVPQVQFLEMLAERGGEVPWDWRKVNPAAKAMLADLINKALIIDGERVTHAAQLHGDGYMRLTDNGRAVVAELAKSKVNGSKVSPA